MALKWPEIVETGVYMVYLMIINQIRPGKAREYYEINAECIRIWEKHGCKVIGVWDNWIGGDGFELITMYSFKNFAEYEEQDAKVHSDPEWSSYVRKIGEVSMGRTTRLLRPTEYSPMR